MDLGAVLFGDQNKKDQLQNSINSIQEQINKGIGNLPALQSQLANLKQQLEAETELRGRPT